MGAAGSLLHSTGSGGVSARVWRKSMNNEQELRNWIDSTDDLDTLLRRWRFAKVGDPMFQGDIGDYYAKKMFGMRDADPTEWTAASKRVGWE